MSQSVWGDSDTQYFFELTPEKILDAVEDAGIRCTGRSFPLNSMENRVYEVEIEVDDPAALKSRSDRYRVVKFYRPGRWTKEQILEEHEFLMDLAAQEIPVVCPIRLKDGNTLAAAPGTNIFYAVFNKIGGRSPDEISPANLEQVGRLLGRIHQVGKAKEAKHRLELNPSTYGTANLNYLLNSSALPENYKPTYSNLVNEIVRLSTPHFKHVSPQRIHGDCHKGNLLYSDGFFFVDFDDMVRGPCVQDFWLILSDRDETGKRELDQLLRGYEQMSEFDDDTLKLIEPLRALRFIHFSSWIAKRWQDPAFPRAFPQFGTPRYWEEQIADLSEQLDLIQKLS